MKRPTYFSRLTPFFLLSASFLLASCGFETRVAQWESYVVRKADGTVVASQKAREFFKNDISLIVAFERSIAAADALFDPNNHARLAKDPRYADVAAYGDRLREKSSADAKLCGAVEGGKVRLGGDQERSEIESACRSAREAVAQETSRLDALRRKFCSVSGILESSWLRSVAREVAESGKTGVPMTRQRYDYLRDSFIHEEIDAAEPDPLFRAMETKCVEKFDRGTAGIPLYSLILASMFERASLFAGVPAAPAETPDRDVPADSSGAVDAGVGTSSGSVDETGEGMPSEPSGTGADDGGLANMLNGLFDTAASSSGTVAAASTGTSEGSVPPDSRDDFGAESPAPDESVSGSGFSSGAETPSPSDTGGLEGLLNGLLDGEDKPAAPAFASDEARDAAGSGIVQAVAGNELLNPSTPLGEAVSEFGSGLWDSNGSQAARSAVGEGGGAASDSAVRKAAVSAAAAVRASALKVISAAASSASGTGSDRGRPSVRPAAFVQALDAVVPSVAGNISAEFTARFASLPSVSAVLSSAPAHPSAPSPLASALRGTSVLPAAATALVATAALAWAWVRFRRPAKSKS